MSKAEEEANKRYSITRDDDTQETSGIDMQRASDFIEGYHQAEKYLELTWEDINDVKLIIEQVECDYVEQDKKLYTKYFYEEVLKRFKERKDD